MLIWVLSRWHDLLLDDLFPNKQKLLHRKFQGLNLRRAIRAVTTDESAGKCTYSIF